MLPEFPDFKNVNQTPTFNPGMVYDHISFPRKALICYISLLRPLHQLMYPVIRMFPCFPSQKCVHQLPTFILGMVNYHIALLGRHWSATFQSSAPFTSWFVLLSVPLLATLVPLYTSLPALASTDTTFPKSPNWLQGHSKLSVFFWIVSFSKN